MLRIYIYIYICILILSLSHSFLLYFSERLATCFKGMSPLLQEAGITPTARHANPLVFAEAMFVSVHTAVNGPLKEMQQGRLGVGCRPNTDSYNCIIMVRHFMQAF